MKNFLLEQNILFLFSGLSVTSQLSHIIYEYRTWWLYSHIIFYFCDIMQARSMSWIMIHFVRRTAIKYNIRLTLYWNKRDVSIRRAFSSDLFQSVRLTATVENKDVVSVGCLQDMTEFYNSWGLISEQTDCALVVEQRTTRCDLL